MEKFNSEQFQENVVARSVEFIVDECKELQNEIKCPDAYIYKMLLKVAEKFK